MDNKSYRMRMETQTLQEMNYVALTNAYQVLGSVDHPAVKIEFQNITNRHIRISDDGVNDKYYVPAGGFILLDLRNSELWIKSGKIYYVKYDGAVAPTSGDVFLTVMYGE